MSRLGALFRKLDSHGSAPCFIEEGVDQPYGALLEAVQVWRAKLAGQGIARGTVVALRSDFSLASTALLLALFDLKAVVVLVPSHREAQSLIRSVRPNGCASCCQAPSRPGPCSKPGRVRICWRR